MILDENNRAGEHFWKERMNSIENNELREIFNDIWTFDNIDPMDFNSIKTMRGVWFSEATKEIMYGIECFDKGNITGGYGNLKAAWELLLSVLYIFAGEDVDVTNSRVRNWKNPKNNFKKMLDDYKSWKNFKLVTEEFKSFKNKQRISDDRLNKFRHKHSSHYFESIRLARDIEWEKERMNCAIEDTKYILEMYLVTWIVISPVLLICSSDLFISRIPQALAAFPTKKVASKYIPEILDNNFLATSKITKEMYEEISKKYEMSPSQISFLSIKYIDNDLKIADDEEQYFDQTMVDLYKVISGDIEQKYNTFIIVGEFSFYYRSGGGVTERSSSIWNGEIKDSDYWNKIIVDNRYEIRTVNDTNVLCFWTDQLKSIFKI